MEKFNKLSRAEMRNVTGGNLHSCTMGCKIQIAPGTPSNPGGTYFIAVTTVPDCTETGESACVGGEVIYCTCGVM